MGRTDAGRSGRRASLGGDWMGPARGAGGRLWPLLIESSGVLEKARAGGYGIGLALRPAGSPASTNTNNRETVRFNWVGSSPESGRRNGDRFTILCSCEGRSTGRLRISVHRQLGRLASAPLRLRPRMPNGGRHCCRPPLHHRLPVRCRTSSGWHGGVVQSLARFSAAGTCARMRRVRCFPPG